VDAVQRWAVLHLMFIYVISLRTKRSFDSTTPSLAHRELELQKTQNSISAIWPLNAYLSIKFPPDAFLVKPQALLRELWDMRNLEDADAVALRATILGLADHTMDVDDGAQRASIDSQGVFHSNSITSQTVYHFVVNL